MSVKPTRNGSDIASFDPSRPDAAAQISGLLFALLLIDPNAVIAQANHAAENMLGRSASRLVGKPLSEIIGPLDPRVENRLSDADSALVARDIRISSGGAEKRVNLTVSTLGGFPGWRVVTLSEIGHDESGNDDEIASSLAAPSILAHEIKNPLAAIRGAAQLAARKLPHQDKKLARMITDEVRHAERVSSYSESQSTPSKSSSTMLESEAVANGCACRGDSAERVAPMSSNRIALGEVRFGPK